MFALNEYCTLTISNGKYGHPYIFLQRKKGEKSNFIYLTLEEWEKVVIKIPTIQDMISRLHNAGSGSGEERKINFRRMLRVSNLNGIVYVGIFEFKGDIVHYGQGINIEEEAWIKLTKDMSKIQVALLAMKAQAKPFTPPSSLPLMPPTSGGATSTDDCKNPVVYKIKVYDWKYTSGCGSVLYRESDRQFYTKDAAKADADKHPVDFVDHMGYELDINTTPSKLVCHMTPEQICLRVYVLYLRNDIRKKMNDSCYGCEVDHPSQVLHMHGGCLSDLTKSELDLHLSPAILKVIFSNCIERILKQLREIIPLPEDMFNHIQTCYDVTESDICTEILKDEVHEIDALINELYFLNNSTNPEWDFMT